MTLNISTFSAKLPTFTWLSKLCETNEIDEIIISPAQAKSVFHCVLGTYESFRGIPLRITKRPTYTNWGSAFNPLAHEDNVANENTETR